MNEKIVEVYFNLNNTSIINIMDEITGKYRKSYYDALRKRANKINTVCNLLLKCIAPLITFFYLYNKISSIESFIALLLGFVIYYVIINKAIIYYISTIKNQKLLPELYIKKKFKMLNKNIKIFEGDYILKFDGNVISLNKHDGGKVNVELKTVNNVFVNENLILLNNKIFILTHSDLMNEDEYAKGVKIIMEAVKKNNPKFIYDY